MTVKFIDLLNLLVIDAFNTMSRLYATWIRLITTHAYLFFVLEFGAIKWLAPTISICWALCIGISNCKRLTSVICYCIL